MLGFQVLHQDKGHAGVQRQSAQQLREGFQSAGRCPDTYDRESLAASLNPVSIADEGRRRNSNARRRRTRFCVRSFRRLWRTSFHHASLVWTPRDGDMPMF